MLKFCIEKLPIKDTNCLEFKLLETYKQTKLV